jgi:hypothetical protein
MQDYEKTYHDHWKDTIEHNDGTLNRDQIMRELHDYWFLLDQVPRVYDEVTGSRCSKPNTKAHAVIGCFQEYLQQESTVATVYALQEVIPLVEDAADVSGAVRLLREHAERLAQECGLTELGPVSR